ncbi:MAG: prepilin-type N-terminal cleavage/methylation domain-containing protein [Clostridium sp.]|uniref:prepilin-type N-terminal cleavage/methylation domain-containing protein n=1 Tax=Clostridium sp. TaxID=1506 RepID=UPI003D6CA64E
MKKDLMKKKKKKGFTLIELIVVIAIIVILAAIAVPRFSGLKDSSKVKAEAATAAQIVSAARIQETETDIVVKGTGNAAGALETKYMTIPTVPAFKIDGGGKVAYIVTWKSEAASYGEETYTENIPWKSSIDAKADGK